MLDLRIEQLHFQIENAAGHEHRIHAIAMRAAALLAERLRERLAASGRSPDSGTIDNLSAPPVGLSLNGMSDGQAANDIATAWLEAVALKLKL